MATEANPLAPPMAPYRPDATLGPMHQRERQPPVIVGYDGCDRSDDALVLGALLAQGLGCGLVIAAAVAYEPARMGPDDYNGARARFLDASFERADAVLGGTSFTRAALQDTPAHGLHELAEEGATLVVLGSSHRGALGRIHPGSVAERLLHGCPCPVAIAPSGYAERDGGIGSIAVGVDGRTDAALAQDWAVHLARAFGAHLELLRVGPDIAWGTFDVPPLEQLNEANQAALARALERVPADVSCDAAYVEGDPAEELVRQAGGYDLLVLGSRGYGPLRSVLLGGVSTYVARHAETPVVVVPRGARRSARADLARRTQAASAT